MSLQSEEQRGLAALVGVKPGQWRLADHRAGDIEIVAIFVGARADDRIVEGDGVGFTRNDVIAEARATRQSDRARRSRSAWRPALRRARASLCAPLMISGDFAQGRKSGSAAETTLAFVQVGTANVGAVIKHEAREIDMRLAGIETGIEMGKADRHKFARAHDVGRLEDEAHRKLHAPDLRRPPAWRVRAR